jgi:hypothetical protein
MRLATSVVAIHTLHLSCRKTGKAPIFTPVGESFGNPGLSGDGACKLGDDGGGLTANGTESMFALDSSILRFGKLVDLMSCS